MNTAAVPRVPEGLTAFGEWFGEVFRLWSAQWQVWVLQGLVFFSLTILPILISYFVFYFFMIARVIAKGGKAPVENNLGDIIANFGIFYLVCIIVSILAMMLIPGMLNTALKQLRGQQIAVSDLFSGIRYFWPNIAIGLLISLGSIACFVGTVALSGLLYLALPLVIDKKASLGEALSFSWNTTKQNFWLYVLFPFVLMLLASAGSAICYIGLIVTLPLMYIGQAVAYERTFGNPAGQSGTMFTGSPVPPPAYMPPPVAGEMSIQPRFCPTCGSQLPEGTTACPRCGG